VSWRRRDDTLREDVAGTGECVLVDRARGRVLALNVTGAAVWDLLDGRRDAAALAAIVAAAAGDVDAAQVEADVQRLLDQLVAEGFVELA
jgi:hypothetical protein